MNENINTLTPVPEEEDEFIFTITNSRGETRTISDADVAARDRRTVQGSSNSSGGRGNSSRGNKLSDAQKIGTDPPPSYDQVITETRHSDV